MSFTESTTTLGSLQTDKFFFKDDYATIALDDSIPCIRLTIQGVPRYSEHYHFVQEKRMELLRQEIKNFPKLHLLTDSRLAGPILEEDVIYFKTQVLTEMEKAGIRCLAVVMPTSKITRLTVKEMTEKSKLNIQYFETVRDAKLWLRKMTNA